MYLIIFFLPRHDNVIQYLYLYTGLFIYHACLLGNNDFDLFDKMEKDAKWNSKTQFWDKFFFSWAVSCTSGFQVYKNMSPNSSKIQYGIEFYAKFQDTLKCKNTKNVIQKKLWAKYLAQGNKSQKLHFFITFYFKTFSSEFVCNF